MTKPHGVDPAGRPLDLIGKPLTPGIGSTPALTIVPKEASPMAKAEQNGRYMLNGAYFRIRKGDAIPEGAEMIGQEPVEERAKSAAPENRKKSDAPENRSKKAE